MKYQEVQEIIDMLTTTAIYSKAVKNKSLSHELAKEIVFWRDAKLKLMVIQGPDDEAGNVE